MGSTNLHIFSLLLTVLAFLTCNCDADCYDGYCEGSHHSGLSTEAAYGISIGITLVIAIAIACCCKFCACCPFANKRKTNPQTFVNAPGYAGVNANGVIIGGQAYQYAAYYNANPADPNRPGYPPPYNQQQYYNPSQQPYNPQEPKPYPVQNTVTLGFRQTPETNEAQDIIVGGGGPPPYPPANNNQAPNRY